MAKKHEGFAKRLWAWAFSRKPRKRMGKAERAKRDAAIIASQYVVRGQIGFRAKDLAAAHDLSASRVRQIVRAARLVEQVHDNASEGGA